MQTGAVPDVLVPPGPEVVVCEPPVPLAQVSVCSVVQPFVVVVVTIPFVVDEVVLGDPGTQPEGGGGGTIEPQ